jgi:hypothetical protein
MLQVFLKNLPAGSESAFAPSLQFIPARSLRRRGDHGELSRNAVAAAVDSVGLTGLEPPLSLAKVWNCAPVYPVAAKGVGGNPVPQPSGAGQAAVTLENSDGEIAGISISDPPTQAEVQALRDKCEELADDVKAHAFDARSRPAGGARRGVAMR